jgi:3-phosphoglycerate kinase
MHKELTFLGSALQNPTRPLAAVVGGAKVSTKLAILRNLLGRVDKLIVGGGMVFTFYRALGYSVGDSIVEEDLVAHADEIMRTAEQRGCSLVLAVDSHIVSTAELRRQDISTTATYLPHGGQASIQPDYSTHDPAKEGLGDADNVAVAPTAQGPLYIPLSAESRRVVRNEEIPEHCTAVDIGSESIRRICSELEMCRTVLWNGEYLLWIVHFVRY